MCEFKLFTEGNGKRICNKSYDLSRHQGRPEESVEIQLADGITMRLCVVIQMPDEDVAERLSSVTDSLADDPKNSYFQHDTLADLTRSCHRSTLKEIESLCQENEVLKAELEQMQPYRHQQDFLIQNLKD